jgi:hypothetical protein
VGKSPSPTDAADATPVARAWAYNHAHSARRVSRVGTASPAIVRTFIPLIVAIHACTRDAVVLNHKFIFQQFLFILFLLTTFVF